MSEPIKVGDLVVVVRPGCTDDNLGHIFRVMGFEKTWGVCPSCLTHHGFPLGTPLAIENCDAVYEVPRLRRIDPLKEPETIEREEGIPA